MEEKQTLGTRWVGVCAGVKLRGRGCGKVVDSEQVVIV